MQSAELEAAIREDDAVTFNRLIDLPTTDARKQKQKNVVKITWIINHLICHNARNIIEHCCRSIFMAVYRRLIRNAKNYKQLFTLLPSEAFSAREPNKGYMYPPRKFLIAALRRGDIPFLQSSLNAQKMAERMGCVEWFAVEETFLDLPLESMVWVFQYCTFLFDPDDTRSPNWEVHNRICKTIWQKGQMRHAIHIARTQVLIQKSLSPLTDHQFTTFVLHCEFPQFSENQFFHVSDYYSDELKRFAAAVATNDPTLIEYIIQNNIDNHRIDCTRVERSVMPTNMLMEYALATHIHLSKRHEYIANGYDLSDAARAATVRLLNTMWYGSECKVNRRLISSKVPGCQRAMLLFMRRAEVHRVLPILPDELWLLIVHFVQQSPLLNYNQLSRLKAEKEAERQAEMQRLTTELALLTATKSVTIANITRVIALRNEIFTKQRRNSLFIIEVAERGNRNLY